MRRDYPLGSGRKVTIVAELGSSHCGDLGIAKALIEEAAKAGADVAKFQLFTADRLCHPSHPSYEIVKKYELPREWLPKLAECAKAAGIAFTATPCDIEAVKLLDELDVPFIKISSGDLTYHRLIEAAAKTGRPLVLSTGMATWGEVSAAKRVVFETRRKGWKFLTVNEGAFNPLTLLHCTVSYPAAIADTNLRAVQELQYEDFWPEPSQPVGFSDHTLSTVLPAVAVGMGAVMIEKHFVAMVDKRCYDSPDYPHSLTPADFKQMVANIREVEKALGEERKGPLPCEEEYRTTARRGLYWAEDLPDGHVVTAKDIVELRSATGFTGTVDKLIGRTLAFVVAADNAVKREDVR